MKLQNGCRVSSLANSACWRFPVTTGGHVEQFKMYRSVHYPKFDICASALTEQFDVIIAE